MTRSGGYNISSRWSIRRMYLLNTSRLCYTHNRSLRLAESRNGNRYDGLSHLLPNLEPPHACSQSNMFRTHVCGIWAYRRCCYCFRLRSWRRRWVKGLVYTISSRTRTPLNRSTGCGIAGSNRLICVQKRLTKKFLVVKCLEIVAANLEEREFGGGIQISLIHPHLHPRSNNNTTY